MTFRETLDEHLRAIQTRNLSALAETMPLDDGDMMLVMSDGRLVRTVREFLDLHRDWFASKTWTLDAEPVAVQETPEMGFATLRLDYRDETATGDKIHERSVLTLIFARRAGRWVCAFDQNTPIRNAR